MTVDHPPTEVTLWWCPRCKSLFRWNVGSQHIPHQPPFIRCTSDLVPKKYFH